MSKPVRTNLTSNLLVAEGGKRESAVLQDEMRKVEVAKAAEYIRNLAKAAQQEPIDSPEDEHAATYAKIGPLYNEIRAIARIESGFKKFASDQDKIDFLALRRVVQKSGKSITAPDQVKIDEKKAELEELQEKFLLETKEIKDLASQVASEKAKEAAAQTLLLSEKARIEAEKNAISLQAVKDHEYYVLASQALAGRQSELHAASLILEKIQKEIKAALEPLEKRQIAERNAITLQSSMLRLAIGVTEFELHKIINDHSDDAKKLSLEAKRTDQLTQQAELESKLKKLDNTLQSNERVASLLAQQASEESKIKIASTEVESIKESREGALAGEKRAPLLISDKEKELTSLTARIEASISAAQSARAKIDESMILKNKERSATKKSFDKAQEDYNSLVAEKAASGIEISADQATINMQNMRIEVFYKKKSEVALILDEKNAQIERLKADILTETDEKKLSTLYSELGVASKAAEEASSAKSKLESLVLELEEIKDSYPNIDERKNQLQKEVEKILDSEAAPELRLENDPNNPAAGRRISSLIEKAINEPDSLTDEVDKMLRSDEGREIELLLKSLGYPRLESSVIGRKAFGIVEGRDDFAIPEMKNVKFDFPNKVYIEFKDKKEAQDFYRNNEDGVFKGILPEGLKYDEEGTSAVVTLWSPKSQADKKISINQELVVGFVNRVRASETAQKFREDLAEKRIDKGTKSLIGGVLNFATLGLPVIPAIAAGIGGVFAGLHYVAAKVPILSAGTSPIFGTLAQTFLEGAARGFESPKLFVSKDSGKKVSEKLNNLSQSVRKLEERNSGSKKIVRRIDNAIKVVPSLLLFAAGTAANGVSLISHGAGDFFSNVANKLHKKSEDLRKTKGLGSTWFVYGMSKLAAGVSLLTSVPFKITGIVTRTVGKTLSRTLEYDHSVIEIGKKIEIGKVARWVNNFVNNARINAHYKSEAKPVESIRLRDDSVARVLEDFSKKKVIEKDFFDEHVISKANDLKGLRFDKKSGIKDDDKKYSKLCEVKFLNRTYEILLATDQTVTIIDAARGSGNEKEKVEKIHSSIYDFDETDFYKAALTKINSKLPQQEEVPGISIKEYLEKFVSGSDSMKENLRNLLQEKNITPTPDNENSYKIGNYNIDFKAEGVAFYKNDNSKNQVIIRGDAAEASAINLNFFNFLQELSAGKFTSHKKAKDSANSSKVNHSQEIGALASEEEKKPATSPKTRASSRAKDMDPQENGTFASLKEKKTTPSSTPRGAKAERSNSRFNDVPRGHH